MSGFKDKFNTDQNYSAYGQFSRSVFSWLEPQSILKYHLVSYGTFETTTSKTFYQNTAFISNSWSGAAVCIFSSKKVFLKLCNVYKKTRVLETPTHVFSCE